MDLVHLKLKNILWRSALDHRRVHYQVNDDISPEYQPGEGMKPAKQKAPIPGMGGNADGRCGCF
jgi:hypothetical protein